MLTRDKISRGPTEARVDADPNAMPMAQWLIRQLEGQGGFDRPACSSNSIFGTVLMMGRRLRAWRCGCNAPTLTLQLSSLAQVDELAGAHPGGQVVLALLHQAELSLPEHVVEPAT